MEPGIGSAARPKRKALHFPLDCEARLEDLDEALSQWDGLGRKKRGSLKKIFRTAADEQGEKSEEKTNTVTKCMHARQPACTHTYTTQNLS